MNKLIFKLWKLYAGEFPVAASKIMFYKTQHKILNLSNPVWFDEKLQWLKLNKYSNDILVAKCADKYEVRSILKENNCEKILNPLVFDKAFDHVDDIPWNELPNKFVIKCTHGCHMNIVCTDFKKFDIQQAKKNLNAWLIEKQWKEQAELHYRHIKPRIIIEEYIPLLCEEKSDIGDLLPNDYKIYCFNGKPKIVLVCTDRSYDVKYNYFDIDWNSCNFIAKNKKNVTIEPPKSFEDMLKYSEILSNIGDFPFVRVDFYDCCGRAIFGEMTFTPSGCNDNDYTKEGQKYLGSLLNL